MFKLSMTGKGYSLLEVMIALVIFASGMISFLMYQARAGTTLFEVESSQMAYSLAMSLAEDINAMTAEEFASFDEALEDNNVPYLDSYIYESLKSLQREDGYPSVSPFDSRGESLFNKTAKQYMFYRAVMIAEYTEKTGLSYESYEPHSYLRHIDVIVGWPRKGHGSLQCNNFVTMDSNCNYVNMPVVRYTAWTGE